MTGEALPQHLLRNYIAAGAQAREAFLARLYVLCLAVALVAVIGLAPPDDRPAILRSMPLFTPPLLYHVVLLGLMRRGFFHRTIPLVNVVVQTSTLAVPFYEVATREGLPFILGGEMQLGWITLIASSALRVTPALSLAAGALGAIEYICISLHCAGSSISSAERAHVFSHGAFFFLSGIVATGIALYAVRQAQQALRSVREQDLMGKYFMHERIGAGGMAEVFRATYSPEGGFEKIVAVKRVLPAISKEPRFLDLFREEASLCSRLSHPNVVQVLDAGRFQETYVLTMEYVDGLSLRRLLQRTTEPLPIAAVTFLGAEIAAALDYLHQRVGPDGGAINLVHCDVNPPNILVSRLGEVKLADFGIAHAMNRSALDPERVYGKLGYLAPEQVLRGGMDGRADLFALGLTLYEMILERPVFPGKVVAEVVEYRRSDLEPMPHAPPALEQLITELLEPSPDDRPRTGAEVRARLLALPGAATPFPSGQIALAKSVTAALVQPATASERRSAATARQEATTKREP